MLDFNDIEAKIRHIQFELDDLLNDLGLKKGDLRGKSTLSLKMAEEIKKKFKED